jgi:hypothetical protein
MKQRAASPDVLVDLADLDDLRTITVSGTTLEIGAMATLAAIMRSSEVEVSRPILIAVAATVADVQVRNRGTLGGTSSTTRPTTSRCRCRARRVDDDRSAGGERTVSAEEFFVGVFETLVGVGDPLTRISPGGEGRGRMDGVARRHGTYVANAVASVADGSWRIALGCVAAVRSGRPASRRRPRSRRRRDGGGPSRGSARRSTRRRTSSAEYRQPGRDRPSSDPVASRESEVTVASTPTRADCHRDGERHDVRARGVCPAAARPLPARRPGPHGTHVGRDTGSRRCTVHLDGVAVKAVRCSPCRPTTVTTVEPCGR